MNYFNTFNGSSLSNSNGAFSAFQCTFNALDKVMELVEENKRLYERVIALEKEKSVDLLFKLLNLFVKIFGFLHELVIRSCKTKLTKMKDGFR